MTKNKLSNLDLGNIGVYGSPPVVVTEAGKMTKNKLKINSDLDSQTYDDGNKSWRVARLIYLSQDLEKFKLPLKCLNIYGLYPKCKTTLSFVKHVDNINNADMNSPIILDEEGYVMDGRHRVCKALLEKREFVWAVRFEKTPEPCYTKDEKDK